MVFWFRRWLPVAALVITLLAAIDPLEGFPVVLIGGVLIVMAAVQEGRVRVKLAAWGLVLAILGCAAMVGLSMLGGVGGDSGRSLWWLMAVLPYPIGVLLFVTADLLILRARSVKA